MSVCLAAQAQALGLRCSAKVSGHSKAAFFGQSSGGLRAARFSNFHPEHVDKLIVDAFVWTGMDAPTLARRAKGLPELLQSNARKVDAKFYRTVFTRDHPRASGAMIGDVVAEAELKCGHTVPSGTSQENVALPLFLAPAGGGGGGTSAAWGALQRNCCAKTSSWSMQVFQPWKKPISSCLSRVALSGCITVAV